MMNDTDIMDVAINHYVYSYHYVGPVLAKNKDYLISLIKTNDKFRKVVNEFDLPFPDDIDLVRFVVCMNGRAISRFSDSIKKNLEIQKIALQQNPMSIQMWIHLDYKPEQVIDFLNSQFGKDGFDELFNMIDREQPSLMYIVEKYLM